MVQREVQKIIRRLAEENSIPEAKIEEVVNSQFKFIKETIINADRADIESFKSIKLMKLFKLVPSKERLYHINRTNKLKDESKNQESL